MKKIRLFSATKVTNGNDRKNLHRVLYYYNNQPIIIKVTIYTILFIFNA